MASESIHAARDESMRRAAKDLRLARRAEAVAGVLLALGLGLGGAVVLLFSICPSCVKVV
jgi:hypothetical protein